MQSKSKYIIRFDDICPTMNWSIWNRIEEILVDNNIKPILAVVPDNRDPKLMVDHSNSQFWERVRYWDGLGWTIALHGYQHVYVNRHAGIMGISRNSEFATLSYSDQERKLKEGLGIFESNGLKPNVWVAPSHSFDKNTLKILASLGIRLVSDGFTKRIYVDKYGVTWVPCQLWDRIDEKKQGVWTVCIHHNSWNQENVYDFKQDITNYRHQIVCVEEAVNGHEKKLTLVEKALQEKEKLFRFKIKRLIKSIIRR